VTQVRTKIAQSGRAGQDGNVCVRAAKGAFLRPLHTLQTAIPITPHIARANMGPEVVACILEYLTSMII